MKIRSFPLTLLLLALLPASGTGAALAASAPDAPPPPLAGAGWEEEQQLLLDDQGSAPPPGLRVVVAAPRAAVIGKASSVLPAMRPGRALNVESGETVRFLSGVREAVWYRGAGLVRSELVVAGVTGTGTPMELGRDDVELPGAAPQIDRGLARVDVAFDSPGERIVAAAVKVGVKPRKGKRRGATRTETYLVRVHEPGTLGSIAGFVGREADGSPLAAVPVLALEAASREVVGGGRSGRDGSYRIERLPPGDYLVAVPAVGGLAGEFFNDSPDAAGASPVEVEPGGSVGAVDFLLNTP